MESRQRHPRRRHRRHLLQRSQQAAPASLSRVPRPYPHPPIPSLGRGHGGRCGRPSICPCHRPSDRPQPCAARPPNHDPRRRRYRRLRRHGHRERRTRSR
ncbi:hypothetical protein CU669_20255 [Paramagnetospirillum kuznetsovii]|uniref:Uncharacterized protein n=1 Tax=Paramagnetospirillum kuznetsovii TaxID=2053833 RepID=A0A364NSS9_9PROT|nr:hypothetical protein CU669_20255 [Paramagnetospirillum kuznetsovii]